MKIRMLLLTVILTIFGISAISFAEGEDNLLYMKDFGINVIEIENSNSSIRPFSLFVKSIEEHIFDECKKHSEIISLEGYSITIEELSDLITAHSEFMIYSGGFTAYVYKNTGYVAYFIPRYLFDSQEEDENARALIADKIKYYTDYAKSQSDDVVAQLLIAHDKLIQDVYYDLEFEDLSFHAYGMLADGKGVCQAYAEIIYMMAKEFGIEAWFCSSKAAGEIDKDGVAKEVGHIWNYIKLDDEWYHLDATWNDPDANTSTAGLYDTAYHKYFLVSDDKMADHETEYEWIITLDEKPVCDSVIYEQNYLFNISAPFTAEYKDGYFNAVITINGKSDVIKTKTLHTDSVLASNGCMDEDSFLIYYAFTKSIKDASFIFAADKDSQISDAKVLVKNQTVGVGTIAVFDISLSSIPYSEEGNNCLFVWSLETLEPYSKKVYMN